MKDHVKLLQLLEALTGQRPPLAQEFCEVAPLFPARGLGYSQLNELLSNTLLPIGNFNYLGPTSGDFSEPRLG